ncbi:MAG: chemotaxis protein CheX [Verrucomicrobia bacterium]|nr:chemotaxis protein CheX [Verrucomicrobiota bacterium]
MSADNINTLVEVTIEVLEGYAFMLGDPPKTGGKPVVLADPSWIVTISFAGSRVGGIGMVVSPPIARQAAANLYAREPAEISNDQAQDAVKELLNIVCGHYIHKDGANEAVIDFGVPALQSVAREDAARYVNGKPQAALVVEGHPLLLFIED